MTRRQLLRYGAAGGAVLFLPLRVGARQALAQVPGGTLPPGSIPKYVTPLVIPPAMPRTAAPPAVRGVDYYEIAVRQFEQHILPQGMGLEPTTVWSYGSIDHPATFNYPAFTVEATWRRPVRVKWTNQLVGANGDYLPHLLPVDQTLHWANPPGGPAGTDMHGTDPTPYTGPVPIVTHLHGGHSFEESDGYAEAWYLPAARNIPPGFARTGSFYQRFRAEAQRRLGQAWTPGSAVFQYDNDQRAATMWYHDHTLGMTRANVYAGPAGFYLLRGGPADAVGGTLPGPAPALGDPPGLRYYEIPIAIQDRSFDADGSLFYPDNRAFFEGLEPDQLQIPFAPDPVDSALSDVPPIWNPEFFGNTIVVNGRTWPFLEVERRRYRLRFLNGSQSRFLILRIEDGRSFWQIGAEGGFLPAPVPLGELLIGPAERADVIVDFSSAPAGTHIKLLNVAPDEPFGGGVPGVDFDPSDPDTTGQVMEFRVVRRRGPDASTHPAQLGLPPLTPLPPESNVRTVTLNEAESETVFVSFDDEGNLVFDPDGEAFAPVKALLGTVDAFENPVPLGWDDAVTENPALGAVEVWQIDNHTEDAHPIHIHELTFEVVDRESLESGAVRGPEPWETGFKDTVIAYPEERTRVRAHFDQGGLFVWHCHILEHEDNEMMRPYCVGSCP
jgi:FtsP/CotA-like multicopper oxidase with cupredoxin domain